MIKWALAWLDPRTGETGQLSPKHPTRRVAELVAVWMTQETREVYWPVPVKVKE